MRVEPVGKINGIRDWIAWKLVDLARWIRPSNEAAMGYMMEKFMESELEAMKYGTSQIEIKIRHQ